MPYCSLPKHDGKKSLAVTRCSAARNALSFCNLVPYNQELEPYYQYFDHLPGIPDSKLAFYGGSVELADYCPFYQVNFDYLLELDFLLKISITYIKF
jgi:leishmanolysin-like peptidase